MQQQTHTVGALSHPSWAHGRSQDLWEAALTLFAERGYRGTTMRDIAQELGIRAPSLYNHMSSKQEILRDIMFGTMERAFMMQRAAVESTDDVTEQLRRVAEAHARLPIHHRREVLITHREIPSLEERDRIEISAKLKAYQRNFYAIIERGRSLGRFDVESSRVASFAILEMLNGLEVWFRHTGSLSEDEVVRQYGDFALRIVGIKDGP